MTQHTSVPNLSGVAVIIPALNEAESLKALLPILGRLGLGQIVVCDNGSSDSTREAVEANGADWVYESRRGYGRACHTGMLHVRDGIQVVVFLDADLSDDPTLLPELVKPILDDDRDFVLGTRVARLRERDAMSAAQRLANWMFPLLIQSVWGHRYTDLGPFRAIRRSCLEAIDMRDRGFGWTVEMQVRAVELGLRIAEVPVPYRRRLRGPSKISGTIRGVALAAYWITRTFVQLWWTRRRRKQEQIHARSVSRGYDSTG